MSDQELSNDQPKQVRLGFYRYYKEDKIYQVIGIATDNVTRQPVVVYIPCYLREGDIKSEWLVAKLDDNHKGFLELVEWEGKKVPRFSFAFEVDNTSIERTK